MYEEGSSQHRTRNSSSSEDTYITASSGTPSEEFVDCVSYSLRNLLLEFNKVEENAIEGEESDNSDSTTANTLISNVEETQIFEPDCICNLSLSHSGRFSSELSTEADISDKQTVISVPHCNSTTTNSQTGSVQQDISFPTDDAFNLVWESRDDSFTSEEFFDRIRNETVRENQEEIIKILQGKINCSENVWLYKIFGRPTEIETQSNWSISPASPHCDEVEGAATSSYDPPPPESKTISRTSSLQRLILSPDLKTNKTSKQIPSLPQEVDKTAVERYVFKILVIGKTGAGKTSIIQKFARNSFFQHRLSNRSVDMYVKVMYWNEAILLQLNLWDIPADCDVDSLNCEDANGSFIVHDVIMCDTLRSINRWKQFIDKNVLLPNGDPIPCVLLANKIDLQEENSVENLLDINTYCESLKISAWYVTSAKEGTNIERAFNFLIVQMLQNKTKYYNYDKPIVKHRKRKEREPFFISCCVN